MILWIVLFFLIIVISFILALQSMRDYQEIPQKPKENGLFLIRQTGNFNTEILNAIIKRATLEDSIISVERLFKGNKTALTIFGPKVLLDEFGVELGLLELEDYAINLISKNVSVWELGVKDVKKFNPEGLNSLFSSLPPLSAEDQFFWQIVLGKGLIQIRAALYLQDPQKQKTLVPLFHDFKLGELIKVPRPFSTEQMMDFYRLRSLSKDSKAPLLNPEVIINLLKIS